MPIDDTPITPPPGSPQVQLTPDDLFTIIGRLYVEGVAMRDLLEQQRQRKAQEDGRLHDGAWAETERERLEKQAKMDAWLHSVAAGDRAMRAAENAGEDGDRRLG